MNLRPTPPADTAATYENRGALVGTAHRDGQDATVPGPRSEPGEPEPLPPLPRRRPTAPRHAAPRPSADLHLTPLYAALVREWEARGAVLPGAVDPDWQFASWSVMDAEVRRILRSLRLQRIVE
ncbi:hypothetical protein [Streptomyces antibioticus]|uniref:hypothetical protein n=1 Tax=Streptomyces antibioticus TaxID=1890 RepID=UPI0033E57196